MIGVALAVETLGWTDLPSVFAHRVRRRWTDVPQQSSSPNTALSRIGQAMEILGMKKGTIQTLPQPVHPSAGAMRPWMVIALTALIAFLAHVQGMALHHAVRSCRLGPGPQASQTLGKGPFARGVLRLPHPRVDLSKRLPQRFGGPIPHVEKGMEKTQEDRQVGAQGLPSALSRLPAISMDGLRSRIGLHALRGAGKNAVRFFPVCLGG